jgi:hypothetical protein
MHGKSWRDKGLFEVLHASRDFVGNHNAPPLRCRPALKETMGGLSIYYTSGQRGKYGNKAAYHQRSEKLKQLIIKLTCMQYTNGD